MQQFVPLCVAAVLVQLAHSAVFKAPVIRKPAEHGSKKHISAKSSQTTYNYMVNVTIGTPPQPFFVDVMPTISYLWVPDSSCKCPALCSPTSLSCWTGFCSINSECCDGNFGPSGSAQLPKRHMNGALLAARQKVHPLVAGIGDGDCNSNRIRFQSSKSSTYKKVGTSFSDTDDGTSDEPIARPGGAGFVGSDSVSLGPVAVKNAQFGQAKTIELSIGIDGVLGIGPSSANPKGVESPIVTAFKQGVIEKPVATLWYGTDTQTEWRDSTTGEITYGGVDETKCAAVPAYHAVSETTDDNGLGWFVKGSVTIGTATVTPKAIQFDFSSGAGFMFADADYEKEFLKGIGVTDSLYFDCNIKFNFTLTIDGHDYVVPHDVLVDRDTQDNTCSLNFLGEGTTGQFVLGETFLKQYCHSFDIGNNRIGFGKNLVL